MSLNPKTDHPASPAPEGANSLSSGGAGDSAGGLEGLAGLQARCLELEQQNRQLQDAQIALETTRQRYLLLFNHSPAAELLLDENQEIVEINRTALQLLETTHEAAKLDFFHSHLSPDDQKSLATLLHEVFQTRQTRRSEFCFSLPTRGQLITQLDAAPVQMADHQWFCLITLLDVTSRVQTEEKADRQAFLLASAQRMGQMGSWSADLKSAQFNCSQNFFELLGLQPGTVDNAQDFHRLILQEDRPDYDQKVAQAIGTRKLLETEFRIKRPDGNIRRLFERSQVEMDHFGQPARRAGVIMDVTQRKQVEEQIDLQLAALSATANAIAITDARGRIEWVNPAFTLLTGYEPEEVLGKNLRMIKSGKHDVAFYRKLWDTILDGRVWHSEVVNQRKGGRQFTSDLTITPVRNAQGQISHFVGIQRDVTDQRKLEEQLRQSQKMQAIGSLAGGIAHDFNNILSIIFGYVYLAKEEAGDNPSLQNKISMIQDMAERARELVRQILTFSRPRQQKLESIQLEKVLTESLKFLRSSMPAGIKIETAFDPSTPNLLGDYTQLYQVALNLATNALHAMEGRNGGVLRVTLDAFDPDQAFLNAHPEFLAQKYIRWTMSDTGHGMDKSTLERIYEPFFTTKPVDKGVGLGLSMVHGIVLAHSGIIMVESHVDSGTTFSLYFKAQRAAQRIKLKPSTAPAIVPGQRQRILIIDDESVLTEAIQMILEKLNYQVTACYRAQDALNLFRKNPTAFDLVVTDYNMPEMNGIQLAAEFHILRPDLPIFLMSGFTPEQTTGELQKCGICEVLAKPVELNNLAAKIQGIFHK